MIGIIVLICEGIVSKARKLAHQRRRNIFRASRVYPVHSLPTTANAKELWKNLGFISKLRSQDEHFAVLINTIHANNFKNHYDGSHTYANLSMSVCGHFLVNHLEYPIIWKAWYRIFISKSYWINITNLCLYLVIYVYVHTCMYVYTHLFGHLYVCICCLVMTNIRYLSVKRNNCEI